MSGRVRCGAPAVPGRGRGPAVSLGAVVLEIRPVRPDEYEALGALTVAAYEGLGGMDLGDYAIELANVAERAALADVLVAVSEGRVLGGVTYVPAHDNPYAEDLAAGEVGIRMLAVDPSAQGLGVGRALMDAALDKARRAGVRGVALHSTPVMRSAHRLYESLGFRRAPARDLDLADVYLQSFVLELHGSAPLESP